MPIVLLRRNLVSLGLPADYVERVCSEVSEHLEECANDLVGQGYQPSEAQTLAVQRLGCPEELAHRLHRERSANSFWFRNPLLLTLTLPLAVFLILGGVHLTLFAMVWRKFPEPWLQYAQTAAARIVIPFTGAWIVYPLFQRTFGKRQWLRTALAVLLILSFISDVGVTPLPDGQLRATLRIVR